MAQLKDLLVTGAARVLNKIHGDLSGNVLNYGVCDTAVGTTAKTVTTNGTFELIPGSEVAIKFTHGNSVANPTLNVNNTGAKAIYLANTNVPTDYILANAVYNLRYDGTHWDIVGVNVAAKFSTAQTITLTGDTTGSASSLAGWNITTKTDRLSTVGDKRNVATTPNDYSNKLIFQGLKSKATIGTPSDNNYSYLIGLRGWSDSSGGDSHELAFNNNGINWRHGASTAWGNWYQLLYSDNSGAGSTTLPIYIDANGKAANTTYSLSASVNTGVANKIAWYSSANAIDSGDITTDGGYLGSVSYLTVNEAHLTTYRLKVNGNIYAASDIITNTNFKAHATGHGLFLKDGASKEYAGIYDNGSNLWIGATSSNGLHHKGNVYISAGHNGTTGYKSIYISIPANGNATTTHTSYPIGYKVTAGSTTKPVYIDNDGAIRAVSYELSADVKAGTVNRIPWYSGTHSLEASDIVTDGTYLSSVTYLTVNHAHQTDYRFYVNGTSYFNNLLYVINDSSNNSLDALTYFRARTNADWTTIIDSLGYNYGLKIDSNGNNALLIVNGGRSMLNTIIPNTTLTYDLGGSSNYWRGAYIGGSGNIHLANFSTEGYSGNVFETTSYTRGWPAINTYWNAPMGNKLFGIPAEAITIQYTTDSGATWADVTDAWYTADRKRNLFNYNGTLIPVGNLPKFDYGSSATALAALVGMGVQVTADFTVENRTFYFSMLMTYWRIYCCKCECSIEQYSQYRNTWVDIWRGEISNTDLYRSVYLNTSLYSDGARVNRNYINKIRWTIIVQSVGTSNIRYVPSLGLCTAWGPHAPNISSGSVSVSGISPNPVFKHSTRFNWTMARYNTPIYAADLNNSGLGAARIGAATLYVGDDLRYTAANSEKWTTLILGNGNNVNAENAHSQGLILLYSAATKMHAIRGLSTTTDYYHYLPNQTSWIASGGNGSNTGVGSSTLPVYLNSSGILSTTTYSLSATINAGTANLIAYYSASNAISSKAPAWKDWVAGTTAGPQAKILIGNADYTSAAIPSASTATSGIITTEDQELKGIKTLRYTVGHYSNSSSQSGKYYKIKINSTTSWMLAFTIRLYHSYDWTDIVISGYNYHNSSTGYTWFDEKATILGANHTNGITVHFGKDSNNELWVGLACANYTGLDIFDVTNGFTQITTAGLFTISLVDSLGGTEKTAITVYRPWYRNETVSTATMLSSNAGGVEQPIYFSDGKPVATSYALKATINNGTTNRIAYYSDARAVSSGSIITDGSYLRNIGGYNNDSYALSAASAIINSWIRTTGATGWYNLSYGGGWYMPDSTWIRMYGNKLVAINSTHATSSNNLSSLLIVGSVGYAGADASGGDAAIELWRGTNASWLIVNSGGILIFRNNYTSAKLATYSSLSITLDYNTGLLNAKNIIPQADLTYNIGSFTKKWKEIYSNVLRLSGDASNPLLTAGARIEFSYNNGTQPITISYTPNDSYRSPAGLKIMGGTGATPPWLELEGNLYLGNQSGNKHIYYIGTKATYSMIRFLDNTADANGNGISIGGGGIVVIGSGESATHFTVDNAGSESTYLLADTSIYLEGNGQTIANRTGVVINTSGNFIPVKAEANNDNKQSLGSIDSRWENIYFGGSTLRTSRIYPYIGSQERSLWYKITFPYNTATTSSASAKLFMNSFDLHSGGGYNNNPAGVMHVTFYWTRAASDGAWTVSLASAHAEGPHMEKINLYYRTAEPGILYVNNTANQYNGIWIDNLHTDDTGSSLDWSTTVCATCSSITVANYTLVPTSRIINQNDKNLYFYENDTKVGLFVDGALSLFPLNGSSYRLGLRIHSVSSWSDIVLCGNDLTGDSGISANSWFIGNNNGSFWIARNGSGTGGTYVFGHNGTNWLIKGHLAPQATNTYTLGTTSLRWKNVYIGTANTYGSTATPVYWNNGVPTAITYSLNATVNTGTATRVAYYSGANAISSGSITTDGGYLGSVSYLSINNAHQTGYRFYVNGNSYLGGASTATGIFHISTATQSTSTATGALTVAGGVGIGKNVYIGGNIFVNASGNSISNITYYTGTANAGKTYIGWIKFASCDMNTSNHFGQLQLDIFLQRSYNSPSSEVYAIRINVGWGNCNIIQLGGKAGSQIINKFRVAKDNTNHKIYLEYYVNTDYTTHENAVNIKIIKYHGATSYTLLNEVQTEAESDFASTWTLDLTNGTSTSASGTANRMAYYSANDVISSGSIITDGTYLHNIGGNNNTSYSLSAGSAIFNNVLRIEYDTPNLIIKDTNTAAETYAIMKFGNKDRDNGVDIYLNGPSRTGDGGSNLFTIRNNVGDVRINNNVWITNLLNIGSTNTNTSYKLYVDGESRLNSCLHIHPNANSYREGIRIYSYSNWSDITLGGADLTATSGTSANSWFIGNNNGTFNIVRNGSSTGTAYFRCVSNKWYVNTTSGSELLNIGGWVGTVGDSGWYNITHGGGWYMTDNTWIKNYNNKRVLLTAHLLVYTNSAGKSFNESGSAIQIREVDAVGNTQSAWSYAPKIGFHWSGRQACQLGLQSNGILTLFSNNSDVDRGTMEMKWLKLVNRYSDGGPIRFTGAGGGWNSSTGTTRYLGVAGDPWGDIYYFMPKLKCDYATATATTASATTVLTESYMQFREYSCSVSGTTVTRNGYVEGYRLPHCDANRTTHAWYNIITTKNCTLSGTTLTINTNI